MLFWHTGVRKGANVFNRKVDSDLIKAAKEYKIGFIRLAPDKFETTQLYSLLGNADNYPGLIFQRPESSERCFRYFSSTKNTSSVNDA
ncbi:hypothetical protein wTkk_000510 [Wolbachia endosymbiont of Trichogramma kaykai]